LIAYILILALLRHACLRMAGRLLSRLAR
jgi:hypothetical protein